MTDCVVPCGGPGGGLAANNSPVTSMDRSLPPTLEMFAAAAAAAVNCSTASASSGSATASALTVEAQQNAAAESSQRRSASSSPSLSAASDPEGRTGAASSTASADDENASDPGGVPVPTSSVAPLHGATSLSSALAMLRNDSCQTTDSVAAGDKTAEQDDATDKRNGSVCSSFEHATADDKDSMAALVHRRIQQESLGRQRFKRLQSPRRPYVVKPKANPVTNRLQQFFQPNQHHSEAEDGEEIGHDGDADIAELMRNLGDVVNEGRVDRDHLQAAGESAEIDIFAGFGERFPKQLNLADGSLEPRAASVSNDAGYRDDLDNEEARESRKAGNRNGDSGGLHEELGGAEEEDLLGGSLEEDDGESDGSPKHDGICAQCREPYTQPPRVLNCLHVFCEACLAKLRTKREPVPMSNFGRVKKIRSGFVIQCPTCKAETDCSEGVQMLPLDYVLMNRLDTEAIHKRRAVCTSCKSEDHAIARCQDCSKFLCSNCQKAHSSMLCFENHKVVSFEAFDQGQAQIHRSVSCLRHPREVALLYDPTCWTTMCNECLMNGHITHRCTKVFNLDAHERNDLTVLLTKARQKFGVFDEAYENLTSSLSELQLTRDSVRSSIEETFITYKMLLERAKNAALEELEKVHSGEVMRVMDDMNQCEKSRVHLDHALLFADKLMKFGDAGEFLALKHLVTTRIHDVMYSCPQKRNQPETRFVTDEAKFAQAVASLFGQVIPNSGSQSDHGMMQTMSSGSSSSAIGILDSAHNGNPSAATNPSSGANLLNATFPNDLSNSGAARLLPSDIVDAVTSSAAGLVSPAAHFVPMDLTANDVVHRILPPGGPPSLPPLDAIGPPAESQLNELRSALAQLNLAGVGGVPVVGPVDPVVDVVSNPTDVLAPLLVGDVAAGPRGMVVGPDGSRLGPPVGAGPSSGGGPTEEENHLMNNLSALAKMGSVGPMAAAPFGAGPVSLNGHGGPLRGNAGPVTPLALATGSLSAGLDPSVGSTGQRSPTTSVTTQGPSPSGASGGSGNSSVGRGNRVSPMHIRFKFGQLGSGPTQFSSPHGFCLGPNEEIVVADTNNHRVQIFDKMGELKNEFGNQGKDEGQLWYPRKVVVMKSTGTYVICDRGNERSRMQLFTKNGEFIKKIAIRYIDIVAGLALTSDGRIVAVDSVSPTVFVIAETGDLLLWFDCSEHMREPSDIAVWGSEFYICDFKGHCVVVYSECGTFLRRIGGEGLTNFPNGIDISDHGDILVGDSHGNRFHIVVFNREGQAISEFECPYCKVSRCCGLKITSEGYVVTLAKNNHHVLILNTLYIT